MNTHDATLFLHKCAEEMELLEPFTRRPFQELSRYLTTCLPCKLKGTGNNRVERDTEDSKHEQRDAVEALEKPSVRAGRDSRNCP